MELRDLKKLAEQLQEDFKTRFLAEDIELPLAFKKNVEGYGDYRFEYKRYMVHIKSSTLDGYIPNVWFFIASYFVDYYLELQKYKQLLTEALTEAGVDKTKRENLMARYPKLSDEKIKSLDKKDKDRESKVILKQDEAVNEIKKEIDDCLSKTNLSENEKNLLSKFVSDYRWWHGGKTIERGDFYVSPILTLSNVVNASHSYIADLCKFLAEQKTYAAMLRYPNAVVIESTLPIFFVKVFTHLYNNNSNLISLFEHVTPGSPGSPRYAYDYAGNRQTNFWVKGEDNYNKCRNGDFYAKPFEYKGEKYYLSLELAKKRTNSNEVSFYGLKPIIESLYQEYTLVEESDIYIFISNKPMSFITFPLQRILYGAPGTGKSFSIKNVIKEHNGKELDMEDEHIFRTTFHPDYDYAQFVGCYKPTKDEDGKITYDFTPQVFTKALVKAYENPTENVYLVIEEINRGNCAQIFGDIFQLLDRNSEGESEYSINVDEDLRKYLEEKCPTAIKDGKIKLSRNFNIIATMNTSDQSLFPMDSAFKRRWEWEYVPVKYGTDVDSSKFKITIGEKTYNWHTFLEAVNAKIKDVTSSEDKQMGNFFIKGDVDAKAFCNKVMFYLWNDVSKDYYGSNDSLFQYIEEDSKPAKHFSFNELFGENQTKLLHGFMKFVKCNPIPKKESDGSDSVQSASEDSNNSQEA